MKFQFSHPSKQSGHSYELSSRARMMDEVNNRAMWKRQCSCLEVESLSLQALQRKFKNNLKLFRFAPNVVVSEVPLSLAGLKGETPSPPSSASQCNLPPQKDGDPTGNRGTAFLPASQGSARCLCPLDFPALSSSISPGSLSELLQSQPSMPATRAHSL